MRPLRFYFIALWLGLGGFAGFELQKVHQQRVDRSVLDQQKNKLEAEASRLRHEQRAIIDEIAQAKQQLESLPMARPTDSTFTSVRQAEIDHWLGNVRKLRAQFEQNPRQRIPEMSLLTDDDWLRVSKAVKLDDPEEIRRALALIRLTATGRLTSSLTQALQKYRAATAGEKPANLQLLYPYFDPPVDAAMLDGYEIIERPHPASTKAPGGPEVENSNVGWGVQSKTPVDPDYDVREQVYMQSGGSGLSRSSNAGPLAWEPGLQARLQRAYQSYSKANQGDRPSSVAKVISYFDPPLDPILAERLIRTEPKE